jgi:hypothetical protein
MDPLEFEKVSVAEVRQALDEEEKKAKKPAPDRQSLATDGQMLLDNTVRWIASLPEAIRPMLVAHEHPRIANSLGEIWPRVALCKQYLDTLVIDRKDGQHAFSPEVAEELVVLRTYYLELQPDNRLAWNQVARNL